MLNKTLLVLFVSASTLIPIASAHAGAGVVKSIDCTQAKQVKICRAVKYNPFARKSATGICKAYYGKEASAIDYKFRTGWRCFVGIG